MIFYFTGTGNSKYIASKIANETGDELISITENIKTGAARSFSVGKDVVFVLPTYAWRIPRVVKNWIIETDFAGAERAWFVMSCGGEIGNAPEYNRRLCADKGWAYMGTVPIIMPDNYIIMFNAPDTPEAKKIIKKAEPSVLKAAETIKSGKSFEEPRKRLYDRFMSSAINSLFYRFHVKTKPFRVLDSCNSCGKCARICPLNNIRIKEGRPEWKDKCTHCMACISYCPTAAIEYGKKTVGKKRYHLDD